MILQSLVRYYEILADDPESGISRPGYCSAKVSFAVTISPQGELLELIPCKISQKRGTKTVELPQLMTVPEQAKRAVNITANFLCENSGYLFGVDGKGKPARSKLCFEAFRTLHLAVLEHTDTPIAKAICAFVSRWNPETAAQHPALVPFLDALSQGALLVFRVDGYGYAHTAPEIKAAWERWRETSSDGETRQCLVCGEFRPVARLHPSIKGVRGAQSTGGSIVSFNAPADESYGNVSAQGLNAPVSQYAAFAYTTVLNHLLSDLPHRQQVGDATVIYWAETSDPVYRDLFGNLIDPSNGQTSASGRQDIAAEYELNEMFERIAMGLPICADSKIDPDTRFYVLGLSPNASRLSVRFFLQNTFGSFLNCIGRHYADLQLAHAPFEPKYIPLWRLLGETVPPASREKTADPPMSGAVYRSILTGAPYPAALYNAALLRIRAEHSVNYYKTAILKACLLRRKGIHPSEREVLTVTINEQNNTQSYLLGRLFSVLESVQQAANPGINTTIKDHFFNAACDTPQLVFKTLLKLKNHHTRKLEPGLAFYFEKTIRELVSRLPEDVPFPSRLSGEEQGLFIKGYYDQTQTNFTKNTKKAEEDAQ